SSQLASFRCSPVVISSLNSTTTMASRLGRQAFARVTRTARPRFGAPKRFMSADSHAPKASSDLPWIAGALAVTVPSLAYLLKDTFAIKAKIAAGHHGHDSHAEHTEKHDPEPVAETPAEPVIMKDDEGKEEDVSASVEQAVEADAPVPEVASTPAETAPEPAAEPPKEEEEAK
ncbi:unnamed protein product, partial [Mycena citricolor]